jgi:hypothetical protein
MASGHDFGIGILGLFILPLVCFGQSDMSKFAMDLGDTMIDFKQSKWPDVSRKDILSHNLQLNIGLGFRF